MKYYTLNQAVKKAYIEKEGFLRANNLSFNMGLYNSIRGLFGFSPKMYYFDKAQPEKDIRPVMFVKRNGDFVHLDRIVDDEYKPKGDWL